MNISSHILALFFLLLSLPCICSADLLSSENAAYDGAALTLSGQVTLDHGLGNLKAEEARLEKQEPNSKEFPFSSILLKRGVELQLSADTSLRCEQAELDFSSLQGVLSAKDRNRVSYKDPLLQITGDHAILQFQRIEHPNKRSDYTVQNTEVDGHVFVEYNRSLTLDADRTIYHTSSPSFRSGQGHLQAFAADQSKRCRIQSKDDTIHAHAIDFDLAHAVLMLQKPEGSLREALGTLHNRDLHFSCDHALWDHPKKMLQLSGNVLIDKAALGELINDKEVLIKQGNQGITSMIARGSSALKFQNQPNMIQRKLVCHRKLVIDHTKMHASCESRSDGSTLSIEEQVSYEEGEIAVYADSASLDYAVDEAHLQPMRVTLKGHVRIFTGTVEEPKRLGLADWVTYSSTTGSFIFGANPGHHVLFLDMQEDTKISAQEVHLTLASSGNQEKITGIGNVQFSFSADEETLLHNLFHTIHDIKTR